MGFLAAFVNIIKTEPWPCSSQCFCSANSPLPAAGGGVLPGEVVLSALRGQHLGAEG